MAYLDTPTIIFTGDFQSDVSTVNNDVRHYDNASFESRFQLPQEGQNYNGWWNPDGGASFRWVDCSVVQVINAQGKIDYDNSLLQVEVSGVKDRSSGKMVDLDPQEQTTSELWGLTLQFTDAKGNLLFKGTLLDTGFRDLQMRQYPKDQNDQNYNPNGQPLGGCWYTCIQDIVWGKHAEEHETLKKLQSITEDNCLSLGLHGFGYYYSHADGRYSTGRTNGIIGPWKKQEPMRFAPTRRLYGTWNIFSQPSPVSTFFSISNFMVANNEVTVDFGMSYPIQDSLGTLNQKFAEQSIVLGVAQKGKTFDQALNSKQKVIVDPNDFMEIGPLKFRSPKTWLQTTAGITSFELNQKTADLVKDNQVLLLLKTSDAYQLIAREGVDGWYMRADKNVFRIDPGDPPMSTDVYVYQWGNPKAGQQVVLKPQPKQSGNGAGGGINQPKAPIPDINFPADAIYMTALPLTDNTGKTKVSLTGTDPGNPRGYIDGQIYLINYALESVPNLEQYFNDLLMIHLRDSFPNLEHPTWEDIKYTWIQFGNLYPIMSKFLVPFDMRNALLRHKEILIFGLTRPLDDPIHMPVTRDLSKAKRDAMVKWLSTAEIKEKTDELLASTSPERPAIDPTDFMTAALQQKTAISHLKSGNQAALESLADQLNFEELQNLS